MRMRVGVACLLVCAALASCARTAPEPRPGQTFEPSITESSPMPTAIPDNPACTLLTKEDRSDLVGYSMDVEVPVRPVQGSAECIWVHSLHEPARAAIRVIALRGEVWVRTLRPQIRTAMVSPKTSPAVSKKLRKVWTELGQTGELADDKVCPTYLLLAEARGAVRDGTTFFYAPLGTMTAGYALSCQDGNMILAGYGEYGIGPSIALYRGVLRLLEAAEKNSDGVFEQIDAGADAKDKDKDADKDAGADEDAASDEDASPSPEPSPTETDESDVTAQDESDS